MASVRLVHVAAALFGSTSWLCVNAVWTELSLLMNDLDEHYTLPSYLDVIIQIGCALVLLIASLAKKFASPFIHLSNLILALLLLGCTVQILLAFNWHHSTLVFGSSHSLVLFILVFALACMSASSNVLFLPYMARFHLTCLTAYFVGMGLSALVPSLISLLQGTLQYECVNNGTAVIAVYEEPRFSVQTYSLTIFAWMCFGTLAFVLLDRFPHLLSFSSTSSYSTEQSANNYERRESQSSAFTPSEDAKKLRYWVLLACLVVTSAEMNSIVMSIQIYSALPYSLLTYHLALTLSCAAQSVFCLLPLWLRSSTLSTIVSLTVLSTAICAYIVLLALWSPNPPFKQSQFGAALSVLASVASFSLNSYLRTLITSIINEDLTQVDAPQNSRHQNDANVTHSADDELSDDDALTHTSKRRLFWCGMLMQVGSLLGSLMMFPLVNFVHLFKVAPPC